MAVEALCGYARKFEYSPPDQVLTEHIQKLFTRNVVLDLWTGQPEGCGVEHKFTLDFEICEESKEKRLPQLPFCSTHNKETEKTLREYLGGCKDFTNEDEYRKYWDTMCQLFYLSSDKFCTQMSYSWWIFDFRIKDIMKVRLSVYGHASSLI